jgi:hypothetical protein
MTFADEKNVSELGPVDSVESRGITQGLRPLPVSLAARVISGSGKGQLHRARKVYGPTFTAPIGCITKIRGWLNHSKVALLAPPS